jgi:hypothetical protein
MKPKKNQRLPEPIFRERWIAPELRKVGAVSDVLKGGGGKLSVAGGDPGDGRKPSGGE